MKARLAGAAFAALIAIAGPGFAADPAPPDGAAASAAPPGARPRAAHPVRRSAGSARDHIADRLNAQELRRVSGGYPAYGAAARPYPPPGGYPPYPWYPPPWYRPAPGWYPPPWYPPP